MALLVREIIKAVLVSIKRSISPVFLGQPIMIVSVISSLEARMIPPAMLWSMVAVIFTFVSLAKAIFTSDCRFFFALTRFFSASSSLGTTDKMVMGFTDFLFFTKTANSSKVSMLCKLAIGIMMCSLLCTGYSMVGSSFSEVSIRREAFSVTKVAVRQVTRISKMVPFNAFSSIMPV